MCESTSDGPLRLGGGSGPLAIGGSGCPVNTLKGGLSVNGHNGDFVIDGNRITGMGSVGLYNVVSSTPPIVRANMISGGLYCSGFSPPPTNNESPNTVGGARTGQCATL